MRIIILLSFLTCAIHAMPRTAYVYGDSHSTEFTGIPTCVINYLGSITMHRVGRDGLDIFHLEPFSPPCSYKTVALRPGDAVIFAFGQIDAGYHIAKQMELQHRTLDEILDPLVFNFFHKLNANFLDYPNVIKIIYSVTPPTDQAQSALQPLAGSLTKRIEITRRLNELLRIRALLFGFLFLDVYDDYADENGALKSDLSDGGVHIAISRNQKIKEKLFEILNNYP